MTVLLSKSVVRAGDVAKANALHANEEQRLRKESGVSQIELDGALHTFYASDQRCAKGQQLFCLTTGQFL